MVNMNLKGTARRILALAVVLVLLAVPAIASAETAKAPEGVKVEFSHLVLSGKQGTVGVLQLVKLVNLSLIHISEPTRPY